MTQLEKIYLLNVLLYIDTVESIKKFIMINKKCDDVRKMVRLFQMKYPSDEYRKYQISMKIIPNNIFLNGVIEYYPDIFCVNDMSYEEWYDRLSNKNSGFMPVCEVKSFFREYKALIYSTKCRGSIYLYSCISLFRKVLLLLF